MKNLKKQIVYVLIMALLLTGVPNTKVQAQKAIPKTRITDISVPMIMKGVLFPCFERHLSETAPKKGSRNSARILSSAMMIPETL